MDAFIASAWILNVLIHSLIFTSLAASNAHSTDSATRNEKISVNAERLSCEDVNTRLLSLQQASVNCLSIHGNRNTTLHPSLGNNFVVYDNLEIIYYEITSVNLTDGIMLQLHRENSFLAPSFQFEERFGDLYLKSSVDEHLRECFYEGRILNDETSTVTINICNGLQGVIRNDTNEYLISPDEAHSSGMQNGHHLLTRTLTVNQHANNGRKIQMCPTSDPRSGRRIYHGYKFTFKGEKLELVDTHKRMRRAQSSKRYMEIMVVADQSVFEFYGKKEVEIRRYLLSIMAIVTSLMKDGSIGNYLEVAVVKLVILKQNPADLRITHSASKSLWSFCQWQKKQNKPNDENPEHFDTAILVTRKNLCSASNKCETLGLAELGSICDASRSCAVVEDNGLSAAFTIAHELGHLLNAPHDGESNDCTIDKEKVHMMTPTFSINYKKWTWSSCSRKSITEFVESSESFCLADKPSPKFEHPLPLRLPGELFSHNQQCQLVYGENSSYCPFVDRCDRIWCKWTRNGKTSCHTNNMPWADGTQCGSNKWCIKGECKPKEKLEPTHGNWGSWGSYSKCSRPCGGGVKHSARECNNPKPSYNGDYCIGRRHKYKSCNVRPCASNTVDFRAKQCTSFNGKNLDIPGVPPSVTWLSKYTSFPEDSCKLFCEIEGYGMFYQLASKVIDGTKCKKELNSICVDGVCMLAGCDNVLGSKAKVDRCGVCNGDGSTCTLYTGVKKQTNMGYNSVVRVPKGASRLRVIQKSSKPGTHDTNFLALLDQKRRYVFNGQWRVSLGRRRYVSHGTSIYYSGPNEPNETLWIPEPLSNAVEVRVLSIGPSDNCNIRYSYTLPVRNKQKYQWRLQNNWSGCFPACKGFRVRDYDCTRDMDSQIVSKTKCLNKKPQALHQKCNQDCDLRWNTVKSECTPLSICGNGVQQQKAVCTAVYDKTLGRPNEILKYRECQKAKIGEIPAKEIPCYILCTTTQLMYTPWKKCNQTCGGGLQQRSAVCVDQKSNTTLPDTNCNKVELNALQRSCNTRKCPTWHTGAWSGACSVTCGEGVVERVVYCMADDETVSHDMCNNASRPTQMRPCVMGACARWKERAWSKCSKPCGVGYKIREIFCETGNGEIVENSVCNAAEKPAERRKCFEKSCQLSAKLEHDKNDVVKNKRWTAGGWNSCSRSCGHGHRTRVVGCVMNNAIVSDKHCNSFSKPVAREICNTFSCPVWRNGAWSKCTKDCGSGTRRRLVLCGFNGKIVSDEYCSKEDKPSENQYCNQQKCRNNPPTAIKRGQRSNWELSRWSQCSSSCGEGIKIRSVTCSSNRCNNSTKPQSNAPCNSGTCPVWNHGQWSKCITDNRCGRGLQQRLVVCRHVNGKYLKEHACDAKFKPVNNQTCELKPCKKKYQWTVTKWHPCNVPCGLGVQFRYILCEDMDSNVVSESLCLLRRKKPRNRRTCKRKACPVWRVQPWGKCDSSCIQRRPVVCSRAKERVNDALCQAATKPKAEQECEEENCVRVPNFAWKVGAWSKCSATCGYALRSRDIKCVKEGGVIVDDALCTSATPAMIDQCFEGPCPPQWYAEAWSECSKTCGIGVQERKVHCRSVLMGRIPGNACVLKRKLRTRRTCRIGSCGDKSRWMSAEWQPCSKSCGSGETMRKVFCVNEKNETQSHQKCSAINMPVILQACNVHNCPWKSCRDVQHNLRVEFDGERTLEASGYKLTVYCEGMHRNNPKEFITLRSDPRENYSEIYGERLKDGRMCPNAGKRQIPCKDCLDYTTSGVTFFKKIRIDIKRMTIIPEDKTFADRFGKNPPGFASAGDCYSRAKCPQGRFMVNLKDTGIVIDQKATWTTRGYHSSQKIRKIKNGEIIYGKCGGFCGMCSPTDRNGLKFQLLEALASHDSKT